MSDGEDNVTYQVVINDEAHYSVWPTTREVPLGWRVIGKAGTKAECLAYIEESQANTRKSEAVNVDDDAQDAGQ
jgi:MbtH protein